jgi:molybdopterin-containing oxidoreductase family iron-sulfur binding subunit
MAFNRREFLRIAGLSTALGVGGQSAFQLIWPGEADAELYKKQPGSRHAVRWGMVIDTRKLVDPKVMETIRKACHLAHNVPTITTERIEIKWIWTAHFFQTFTDQENVYLPRDMVDSFVMTLCNHCDEPPCVRVCPTQATFRRDDGIVMMDFHRCIGCRFCMAGCPYGSRSFNFGDPRKLNDVQLNPKFPSNDDFPTRTKGVVEKCNFCAERLAEGLEPACVEAAPDNAIAFGDLADPDSPVRQLLRKHFSIRRKPSLGTQPSVFYLV